MNAAHNISAAETSDRSDCRAKKKKKNQRQVVDPRLTVVMATS